MIEKMTIRNFRSIYNADIALSPLTVLIGPNGSGKSNFVKSLQFLSDIVKLGLQLAINRNGGYYGILPKAFTGRKLREAEVGFDYVYQMIGPSLSDAEDIRTKFNVSHELQFFFRTTRKVKVRREEIKFENIFAVLRAIEQKEVEGDVDQKASFTLTQSLNEIPDFIVKPNVSPKNRAQFLRWIGLSFLEDRVKDSNDLRKALDELWEHRQRDSDRNSRSVASTTYSFLDPYISTILDFSRQFRGFVTFIGNISLYDLRLGELRREHAPGSSREFSKSGDNMPSMIRRLLLSEQADSWARIRRSLTAIAPHITNVKSNTLKTGKEYVEFAEAKKSRRVESWESSDGTLRALAILVALETARPGQIVVIEEPEQNLHPWAINSLVDHMREVIETRHIQIILTTHSQQVLERVNADEVRIVSRNTKRGTQFSMLRDVVPHGKIAKGDVGRMWVKGLLSGVPDTNQ